MEQRAHFSHIGYLRVPTRITIEILVGTLIHIFPVSALYIDILTIKYNHSIIKLTNVNIVE